MNFPKYERYKESWVDWIGEVPEHWEVKAARFGYDIQLGKMLQPEPGNSTDSEVPYLKSQHVQWGDVRLSALPQMWASEIDKIKYGVKRGDLLVCEGGDVGRAGLVQIPPLNTIIQNALHRVRSSTDNLSYLLFVLQHAASKKWFEILCNRATIAHFTGEKFNSLRIPSPPHGEQTTIANFLDQQTARIDLLVTKKKKLVEKLQEQRSALISRTVTKGLPADVAHEFGLDPHTRFKPSGVDWLGDIPEGWGVKKLPYVATIAQGQVSPQKAPYLSMLLIGPEHVEKGTGKLLARATAEEQSAESGKYLCGKGDVVYSKIRPALHKLVLAPEDCICSADMYPLNGKTCLENQFLYWVFLSDQFLAWSILESDRVAMPKINRDTLHKFKVQLPPLNEQTAIARYLALETSQIDNLVGKVTTAIERLQEYRTALITAAVTGKIDVRNIASGGDQQ
jgi:type I restriction enzyme, S subunit